ncbi:chloride channel protein [Taibaiella soli]|uniref:Chloride channel protein n=1 Tax=Taibaiella soli TaxID=1649169 RepID=A0A2W2BN16_9BACT|nr:chloride channel protein [Taibaiella soli]PZF74856.1 chloride channel protein [Taibaiella soli]
MSYRISVKRQHYGRLLLMSLLVGIFASALAFGLKHLTEHVETYVFSNFSRSSAWFIILPSVGMTAIYFLRKYFFKGKANKGVKEIYRTIEDRRDELPAYKIPSHFINGFLTVIFGGSTGVEVSTVVATAAVGSAAYNKNAVAKSYKTELICAGVAAGVATLFNSPLGGLLFAIEVISRRTDKSVLLATLCGILPSAILTLFLHEEPLFHVSTSPWNPDATFAVIVLCAMCAFISIYFTRVLIYVKKKFAAIDNNFLRVNIGALIVGVSIYVFPQLFGDSYHAVNSLFAGGTIQYSLKIILLLVSLIALKPLVASLTLGAGGDGGVFAPSIVVGAILGVVTATTSNHYFGTHFSLGNFMVFGIAAALSAAIHAPLTALMLACGIVPGGFALIVPTFLASFAARYIAHYFCEYTVYSYENPSSEKYPHRWVRQIYRDRVNRD